MSHGYETTRVTNPMPARNKKGRFMKRGRKRSRSPARRRSRNPRPAAAATARPANPRRRRRSTRRRNPSRYAPARRRATNRAPNPRRRRRSSRRRNPAGFGILEVLLIFGGTVAGAFGGGMATAYAAPHLARVGRGLPAALANGAIGALIVGLGLWATRKTGRYRLAWMSPVIAAAVPWGVSAIQELGLLDAAAPTNGNGAGAGANGNGNGATAPPPNGDATGRWYMQGGLHRGVMPSAVPRQLMAGGLHRGAIPGAIIRRNAPMRLIAPPRSYRVAS